MPFPVSLFSDWPPRRLWLALAAIILPVAYLSLFYRMGSAPVRLWDESRLGLSALEMLNNGNWLVTTFQNQPDLWSPKPPLLIWVQAGLFWAFGANEVTLRLPSALAGLATAGLLAWFGIRVLKSPLTGLLSALVLLTTNGYVEYHITRNGDYDAPLVFFTTWYVLSFYQYLETGQRRQLWHTGIGIVLAVLTKSVAGALFLPALVLYAALRRQLLPLLRRREVYAMAAGVVVAIGAYYVSRELVAPGYWKAVYESDLGGRLLSDLSKNGVVTTWTWYLDMLVHDELLPWLYVFPLGFLALLHPAAPRPYRHLALLIFLVVGLLLTVISSAQTKFFWYEAPIYPFCALLTGAGLALLAEGLLRLLGSERRPWPLLPLLLCVFAYPLTVVWRESFQPAPAPDLLFGQHLRQQAREFGQLTTYSVLSGLDYNSTLEFYRLAAVRNYGHDVRIRYSWQLREVQAGETVVVCNPGMRAKLDSIYTTTPVFGGEPCVTLLVTGFK